MKLKLAGLAGILFLLSSLGVSVRSLRKANQKLAVAMANIKSYNLELSREGAKNVTLQLTVEQLKQFNDSVLKELDSVREELGIKDKRLRALQKISSGFSKVDTISVIQVDTLFRDLDLSLDTLLGDDWYKLQLGLRYPSTIIAKPEFKSEKFVIVSSKKETINPPKKFFLFRWFQKKHLVLQVDVKESNPYVEQESSKYIEIIR